MILIDRLLATFGRGLIAGMIGTAAMTASSTLEARIRKRPASTTPAKAAEEMLDIEPKSKAAEERLSNAVHWGYGTGWGLNRSALDLIGIRGPLASALHFAAVWGVGLVMLPALRLTPPPQEWGREELAIDGWHHLVYAMAAGAAYDLSSRRPKGS